MTFHITYVGAKWCGTCKTIKPAVEQLAKRYGVELKTLDLDDDLEDHEKERITKVPTITIFKEDHRIAEWNANQVASLETYLAENVKLTATDDF